MSAEHVTGVAEAVAAEQTVLGAMLDTREGAREALRAAAVEDFYRPQHQTLFALVADLVEAGKPHDPVAVLGELQGRGQLRQVGDATYLHTLYAAACPAASVGYYCRQIKTAAQARRIYRIGQRLTQMVEEAADGRAAMDDLLTNVAGEALALDLIVDQPADVQPVQGVAGWGDFLEADEGPTDWVVPLLIERQDVFMILAAPGAGKSWLSRQMCLAISAGVHPFDPDTPIDAQRTLLVDLENPPGMVRRQSRPVHDAVQLLATESPAEAFVWMRPEGLNLRKREDAQLLERVVAETRPRFVALGSLYKSFQRGKDDWDTAAEETRAVFDRLRSRYGVALWLEHHMPRGQENRNPFGSTVWERWPGFGRVLSRLGGDYFELAPTFRGDRDVREIPAGLKRGGRLPWHPIYDRDELEHLAAAAKGGPVR